MTYAAALRQWLRKDNIQPKPKISQAAAPSSERFKFKPDGKKALEELTKKTAKGMEK